MLSIFLVLLSCSLLRRARNLAVVHVLTSHSDFLQANTRRRQPSSSSLLPVVSGTGSLPEFTVLTVSTYHLATRLNIIAHTNDDSQTCALNRNSQNLSTPYFSP